MREIRSPLRIAQWYESWPGSILQSFKKSVRSEFGVELEVQWDVYTSNDVLLDWMASGRTFDVVFPTQYTIEQLIGQGWLRPLDPDLLPNLENLFPEYLDAPWVRDDAGRIYGAAYRAGNTGLAYRTDRFDSADVESLGWDLLWLSRYGSYDLDERLGVLLDCRELMGIGIKKAGYDASGKALVSEGQWSLNTEDLGQVASARDVMLSASPRWTSPSSPSLTDPFSSGTLLAGVATSPAAIDLIEPYSSSRPPIEYVLPRQGFHRWVDSAGIPSSSGNVFTAHLFIDFLLRADNAKSVAEWNMSATPNAAAYDLLTPLSNDSDLREDARIYPDATSLARGEFSRALPDTVQAAYDAACAEVVADVSEP